jgi:integrase
VNEVERGHILEVLQPIWLSKPETARRVRQRVTAVPDWAYAEGHRDVGAPAARVLDKGLPKHRGTPGHFKSMPFADVSTFLTRLRGREGMGALALEFAILTAARSGEVRCATWDEIDFDAAIWTIPSERTKRKDKKNPHAIPLAPASVDVLRRAMQYRADEAALIFPGIKRSKPPVSAGPEAKRQPAPLSV